MTKEEFESIYRQHYAKMYRLARMMLYDADESKDVVSDIFARLLREKNQPQQNQTEGYLMTAVRNRCRDVLSHKSIRERVERLFLQESMQGHIIAMNDDDRLERLMQFIEAELPPLSQQIFRLRFLSEMSYEEVAQAAGVSKVTVYNHLSQSVQRIKEYFQQQTAKR
ncbi:MAG: sigma-70 family RNA polymerase sigma factor [Prevotella sp.]|nr:sigma-70 family RNA polymerase sigma factor [Prevotella sp.]